MIHNKSEIVSRVKINGKDQLKNLASLMERGYDIYFIETMAESESSSAHEPFFYYEALRNKELIRAVTPLMLLQLANNNRVLCQS